MEKVELNLNGEQKEVIIRSGDALELLQQKQISKSGNIESPAKFHAIRKGEPQKSVVTYSRSRMEIVFEADPESPLSAKITGNLLLNDDLKKFEINTQKMWGLQELAKFLKMNKSFFKEREKTDPLIASLLAFKGTITTDIEKANDGRGNAKDLMDRKTTSNMPTDFVLQLPVFVGGETKSFRVEIGIDSTDASAKFWLESSELQEIIISERDRIIDLEIEKFKGLIIIQQ